VRGTRRLFDNTFVTAAVGLVLVVLLGFILFDLPATPVPVAPFVACPGGLRLQGLILPRDPSGKGPLTLAVEDGDGIFSFFLTPQPSQYNTADVLYRQVSLGVCHPIVGDVIVPSAFLVGAPAPTALVAEALAQLWQVTSLRAAVTISPAGRLLSLSRLLPPGERLLVRFARHTFSPPLVGATAGAQGAKSFFLLPPDVPAGSGVLEILAPPSWRSALWLTVPPAGRSRAAG
jgi:hypothetical protein